MFTLSLTTTFIVFVGYMLNSLCHLSTTFKCLWVVSWCLSPSLSLTYSILLQCESLAGISLSLSLSHLSTTFIVFVGRKLMSLWMGEAKIHELYTAACGLYVCWVVLRIGTVLYNWIPQGTSVILNKVKEWVFLVSLPWSVVVYDTHVLYICRH